ncbi:MAG: M28 family metallopeptidase [Pseudomonadota bacterium]|nr:M28 family metallopeptidase [Pseudomonadota bacterium]
MKFKRFAAVAALLSLSFAASAQAPATGFTPERFRAHVAFLADDLLEGREAGTRGYDIAARYVATRFEALGLTPANGGSWYQQVPFVRFAMIAPAQISVGDRTFVHGRDLMFRQSPEAGRLDFEAPAVFAGYGIHAPELGFDDYRGLDVRGRVVVLLGGVPQGLPSDLAAHLANEKVRTAARRGAAGVILLRGAEEAQRRPYEQMPRRETPPGITWVDPAGVPYVDARGLRFLATADTPFAEALFEDAPRSLAGVRAEAARPGVQPRGFTLAPTLRIERESANSAMTSPNVVAVLPGTDPAVADEYVLLMAHLDGVGIAPGGEGDRIRNGAMDNASGVATLLEVAWQMALPRNRPRRPLLFAAVTAEEKGLLGAQYLARHPVVDGRVVGVVNLDMPVLTYDFSDVIAFGAEHSTLGPIVRRAAARMNVALAPDPMPEQRLFTRSDHYMFVREGVPSVFLMTGFAGEGERAFRHFLATHYHAPTDDLTLPFDWRAAARFAELNYLIAREIADAPEPPRWYQDSFFGNAFAPEAQKAPRPASGGG